MKKGDIIEINSKFDFTKIPDGSIIKVISTNNIDEKWIKLVDSILVKIPNSIKSGQTHVYFININSGKPWDLTGLDDYQFEIIRYGAK